MKTSTFHSDELFFIISPPADILRQIANMKRQVRQSIGRPFEAELSIGHISLHKDSGEHVEASLDVIDSRLSAIDPFEIEIKDFNVFFSSKTIFLDIVNKGAVHDVFEGITRLPYDGVPHVTIAKNLAKPDFQKAWSQLTATPYSTKFICDHIKVLRRSKRRWMHYTEIPLKSRVNRTALPPEPTLIHVPQLSYGV